MAQKYFHREPVKEANREPEYLNIAIRAEFRGSETPEQKRTFILTGHKMLLRNSN